MDVWSNKDRHDLELTCERISNGGTSAKEDHGENDEHVWTSVEDGGRTTQVKIEDMVERCVQEDVWGCEQSI